MLPKAKKNKNARIKFLPGATLSSKTLKTKGTVNGAKHSVINNCVFDGFMVKRFHEATNDI